MKQESEFPLMKKLAKKLNESRFPSGCTTVTDCIEMVKKSKRPTVLIHVNPYFILTIQQKIKYLLVCVFYQQTGPIKVGMMDDFRKTDQCNFAFAQKSFDNYPMTWMTRKRDPLMEMYNRGYIKLILYI